MNKTIACSVDKAREELGYRPGCRAAGGHEIGGAVPGEREQI
jgi:hypothetical protein